MRVLFLLFGSFPCPTPFSCHAPSINVSANPPSTSPVSLFQTLNKMKSLKLQTYHLHPLSTWPLAFWKVWTPLNSLANPSPLNNPVLSLEQRKTELLLLLPPAFKCRPAHTEMTVKWKKSNKNHFYEMVRRKEPPLCEPRHIWIWPYRTPFFLSYVRGVCKDAPQTFSNAEVTQTCLDIWTDNVT